MLKFVCIANIAETWVNNTIIMGFVLIFTGIICVVFVWFFLIPYIIMISRAYYLRYKISKMLKINKKLE